MDRQFKNKESRSFVPSKDTQHRKKQQRMTEPKLDKGKTSGRVADAVGKCAYCNRPVLAGLVICPHCGHSLTPAKCSFCGAHLHADKKFCTHCGAPKEGICCPACGTLNARNFCRNCNAPLTAMAQKAYEQARKDPQFQAIQRKAVELNELRKKIDAAQKEPDKPAEATSRPVVQLSQADKAMLDEYRELIGSVGAVLPDPVLKQEPIQQQPRHYADESLSIEELMEALKAKEAEMDAALAALAPPPDFTPEEQRDYYSARMLPKVVYDTECDMKNYHPIAWICNYCGCRHFTPSQCYRPELGGRWVTQSREEYMQDNTRIVGAHLEITEG